MRGRFYIHIFGDLYLHLPAKLVTFSILQNKLERNEKQRSLVMHIQVQKTFKAEERASIEFSI